MGGGGGGGGSRKGIVRITVIILWTLPGIPHILPEAILLNFNSSVSAVQHFNDIKGKKKRGVVRNCSKNYITNCIIIQLLVYRNTILLKKKKEHTHTLL